MSQNRDDYAPKHEKSSHFKDSHDIEPADPDTADHATRRGLPLVPDSVKSDRLPEPFVTDEGRAVTVAEAGEAYLQIQSRNWKEGKYPTKYEYHKSEIYPRILHADRQFQAKYDDLTAVMLTRRLSPSDDDNNWLTPWECNEMLHGGGVHRSVRDALKYHLGHFEYEWIAVTAPTRSAGTPHEHIYLWIDDPDDDVTADHVAPALDKHLEYCANAYEKHHRYRTDGTGEAITVQHDPDLRKQSHDGVAKQVIRGNTPPCLNTAGAHYIASQLAHLPVGDYYAKGRPNPPQALFEGAALAWASPRNWFRASRGVP